MRASWAASCGHEADVWAHADDLLVENDAVAYVYVPLPPRRLLLRSVCPRSVRAYGSHRGAQSVEYDS